MSSRYEAFLGLVVLQAVCGAFSTDRHTFDLVDPERDKVLNEMKSVSNVFKNRRIMLSPPQFSLSRLLKPDMLCSMMRPNKVLDVFFCKVVG